MNKSGIGAGSASIILVFAVLCLTIFSLITYVVAGNDRVLVDAKVNLVTGYYQADAAAERVIFNLFDSGEAPGSVEIHHGFDETLNTDVTFFSYPISDTKSLFVSLLLHDDSYDILSWRMYNTDEWEYDGSLNIWTGDED